MEPEKALKGVEVFCAYHSKDEKLWRKLEKHLMILERRKIINAWSSHMLRPGEEQLKTINAHINTADIILLLVSPDFLASDYCYEIEVKRAIERFETSEATVIPIILRPVNWKGTPFSGLQILPTGGKAVINWRSRDDAFYDISLEVQYVAEKILERFSIHPNQLRYTHEVQDVQEVLVQEFYYDIVLAFAIEDRFYAEELFNSLCTRGIKVFCYTKDIDKEMQPVFWGKNPHTFYLDLDERPGRFCVLFLSQNYATKFANYEQESALARALQEQGYILPIYLDDTVFPGINEDTVFSINWHEWGAEPISELLAGKVRETSRIIPQILES